jgi:hypothetical protein
MKFFERWKKNESDLKSIENLLQRNLVPVVPAQEFVAGLRQNILNQIPNEIEVAISAQKKNLQTGLVVTGGILGGILIVLSGLRGLISLVGMATLLINWFRQYSQQTPTTT